MTLSPLSLDVGLCITMVFFSLLSCCFLDFFCVNPLCHSNRYIKHIQMGRIMISTLNLSVYYAVNCTCRYYIQEYTSSIVQISLVSNLEKRDQQRGTQTRGVANAHARVPNYLASALFNLQVTSSLETSRSYKRVVGLSGVKKTGLCNKPGSLILIT